jgi:protein O-GlcNAc transferase
MNINKLFQLAVSYYHTGNLQKAESLCQQIIRKKPKHVDTLNLLGLVHYYLANYDSAIEHIRKALELNSDNAESYTNLGNAYKSKGQLDKAVISYEKAIKLKPDLAMAHNNLGSVLQEKGRIDEAVTCYQKALKLDPSLAMACNNLGVLLQEQERPDEAIKSYQKAFKLDPRFHEAYNNLGETFRKMGRLDEAIKCYQKAIELNPRFYEAYNNLGIIFQAKGRLDDAEVWYKHAIQIKPSYEIAHENLLFEMLYNPRYDVQTIFSEHVKFGQRFAEHFSSGISPHNNKCIPDRRLRIGYISPDFRRHAVAYFFEPVIMAHNHEHFEIYCYSNSLIHDEVTRRIRENADQWRKIVGISDQDVCNLIQKDEIDILIDLAGHTANNRISVFSRKPAPIQISWIGYLATTGLSAMDYKISDNYTDPFGKTEQFHTESILRLPETFLCYLPDRASPEVGPLPAVSTGHITFGSFNNFAKVTSEVFSLWAKIIEELPDSRLILKGKCFRDRTTCQYAIDIFARRGIVAERIILQPSSPAPTHLESYNLIDIGLDTFPFNGAATTCEALWMGVPIITIVGTAYHSRVGASLLSNVGLPEMVSKTSDEYVSTAINLAKDLNRLQSLREHLRDMMACSPLCDANRFTANLEICYRQIWMEWCKSV